MSDTEESLGEILGGSSAFHAKPEPAVEPKVEAKAEPEAVEAPKAPARDDSGKFTKTDASAEVKEPAKAEVKTDEAPLTRADVAAIIDERRKRQELERQLQQVQQTPPPSIYEDEDGAINARVDARTNHLKAALLQQSVRIAQMVHKDSWADAEAGFHEACEANPHLVQQFREASDPGEFIYQTGIYHKEMAKYGGSVVAMRDAIRSESKQALATAETRIAALEKELADMKAAQAEAANIPKSLNKSASAHVNSETVGDDEDISQIVRFGN